MSVCVCVSMFMCAHVILLRFLADIGLYTKDLTYIFSTYNNTGMAGVDIGMPNTAIPLVRFCYIFRTCCIDAQIAHKGLTGKQNSSIDIRVTINNYTICV